MKGNGLVGLLVPKDKGSSPDVSEDEDEKADAAADVMAALKDEDADAFATALERFVMCCSEEG
jgi:hypothetical protein